MFTTIGIIIVSILVGGGLLALFGFFGPLTADLLAVMPFVVFAGCVAFIFLIAGNILKTILSIPGRSERQGSVEYVEIREKNRGTSKITQGSRQKQVEDGRKKRKPVKKQ